MNKKTVLIAVGVGAALLGVVALTLLLISEQQDTRSRADSTQQIPLPTTPASQVSPSPIAQAQQSCPTPNSPTNVLVDFPNCVGDVCNFTEANCTWDSVTGATQYNVVVTENETGNTIRNETVEASVTRVEFPVNTNTYKCDVSALNSCGNISAASSHELFCETDAIVEEEPTPIPTTPPLVECGFPCTSTPECQSGLTCAITIGGQGYCSIPTYEASCVAGPSVTTCCTAPTIPPDPTATPTPIPPTLAPTGIFDGTVAAGAGVILLLLLGAALIML